MMAMTIVKMIRFVLPTAIRPTAVRVMTTMARTP